MGRGQAKTTSEDWGTAKDCYLIANTHSQTLGGLNKYQSAHWGGVYQDVNAPWLSTSMGN